MLASTASAGEGVDSNVPCLQSSHVPCISMLHQFLPTFPADESLGGSSRQVLPLGRRIMGGFILFQVFCGCISPSVPPVTWTTSVMRLWSVLPQMTQLFLAPLSEYLVLVAGSHASIL